MRRVVLGVVALAFLASLGLALRRVTTERRAFQELTALGDRLRHARVAADSCQNHVALAEARFLAFDELVDSLHGDVRSYEGLDVRGVPQEEYNRYLESFEGYNDSVASWEARAEVLRASEAACRALIIGHNALSDSLRQTLEARGR